MTKGGQLGWSPGELTSKRPFHKTVREIFSPAMPACWPAVIRLGVVSWWHAGTV